MTKNEILGRICVLLGGRVSLFVRTSCNNHVFVRSYLWLYYLRSIVLLVIHGYGEKDWPSA